MWPSNFNLEKEPVVEALSIVSLDTFSKSHKKAKFNDNAKFKLNSTENHVKNMYFLTIISHKDLTNVMLLNNGI